MGRCANDAVSEWTSTSVPPSTIGNASRQSRRAKPSDSDAAVIGLSGSRGKWGPIHGTPEDERVERLVELDPSELDGAQERLGVRDRGRPAECCHCRERARDVAQDASRRTPPGRNE